MSIGGPHQVLPPHDSLDSSPISVTAVREDIHVAVSTADEGRGVPAACLAHLFLKFSRMQSEEQGGDTGLGLAISNRATRRR